MLKRNKDGLYYVSKIGRRYELDSGSCINADRKLSSDICYILDSGFTEVDFDRWMNDEIERLDENQEVFVGFFYGSLFLTDEKYKEEYEKVIEEIVDEYECQITSIFSENGINKFYADIEDAALSELTKIQMKRKPDEDKLKIKIQVGNHHIAVPFTDNNYIRLYNFLIDCRRDTVSVKDIRKEGKIMDKKVETNQNNYKVKDVIDNSCYSSVFLSIMNIMNNEFVDGWYAMEFLSWLKKIAKDFNDYINDNNCDDGIYKEIYFAVFCDNEDMVKNIIYGTNLQCCLRAEKHVKYYRICLTWDAKLEEISPILTMEERILKTLETYHLINHEVLEEVEIKDLEEQIEYMKNKIKEK